MIVHELRLLLTASHRKLLSGVLFLALFCALVLALAAAVPGRTLFAPFTIGVVDPDQAQEITLLLEVLKNHESLGAVVGFERMSAEAAAARLDADDIPAYIMVPPGFTQGVMVGENPPLTLVGNESRVIQLSVARLLAGAGVAFLTTSQAGIYSTLDYAYEQGMDWGAVTSGLVIPINVEYMKALLDYPFYFHTVELTATDDIPRGDYYRNSTLIFLLYLLLVTLTGTVSAASAPPVMRRMRMCGIPLIRVMLTKWAALWCLLAVLLLPLTLLYGATILAVAALLSALALMSAQLFPGEHASGLFVFSFAVVTLFVSGGALPLAFLPQAVGRLAVLMPNYWFIRMSSAGWLPAAVFCGYGALFFAVAYLRAKARCAR